MGWWFNCSPATRMMNDAALFPSNAAARGRRWLFVSFSSCAAHNTPKGGGFLYFFQSSHPCCSCTAEWVTLFMQLQGFKATQATPNKKKMWGKNAVLIYFCTSPLIHFPFHCTQLYSKSNQFDSIPPHAHTSKFLKFLLESGAFGKKVKALSEL